MPGIHMVFPCCGVGVLLRGVRCVPCSPSASWWGDTRGGDTKACYSHPISCPSQSLLSLLHPPHFMPLSVPFIPAAVTPFHAPLSPFYPCPALPLGPLHPVGLDDAGGAQGVNLGLCSALAEERCLYTKGTFL